MHFIAQRNDLSDRKGRQVCFPFSEKVSMLGLTMDTIIFIGVGHWQMGY